MYKPLIAIFYSALLSAVVWGCGNSGKQSQVEAIAQCDSLPLPVKELVKAVNANDSAAFASFISYPLSRPYPLHDIADEAAMRGYYTTIMDDSLREVILTSPPDAWSEAGWRGWTVADGEYLWIDNELYNINYVSARERNMIASLVKRDMESLPASMRNGWSPEGCYVSERGEVYRIDRALAERAEPYRLSIYDSVRSLSGEPRTTYYGAMFTEGTMATPVYSFGEKNGPSVLIEPYLADSDGERVTIVDADGNETVATLTKAYWLDIIR